MPRQIEKAIAFCNIQKKKGDSYEPPLLYYSVLKKL